MDNLGVPCPSCGSVEVVVGAPADLPVASFIGDDGKAHVARFHDCTCKGCRHKFHHDFAFSA